VAGCTPGKTQGPAAQLGAADGEASAPEAAEAILPGRTRTHPSYRFSPAAGQAEVPEGGPGSGGKHLEGNIWKDWLTTAG